jgi:Domain of unknown function (DUF5666)
LFFTAGLLVAQSSVPSQQGSGVTPAGTKQDIKPSETTAPQTTPSSVPGGQSQKDKASATPVETPAIPSEPQQPKTEILDTSATSGALATDGHDPILDPPPFPTGTTTLVGGVIGSLDRIRNRITVDVYGGGHWTILFDERTHIFRGGAEVTQLALKKGDRVYVDTMLDNNNRDVFARNIRVGVLTPPADIEGQIFDVDWKHNVITVHDSMNAGSVRFVVDQETRISHGPAAASFRDLQPGSLVKVKFAAERSNRGLAREILIVAVPGTSFTFAGTITFLDTHRGVLAVKNAQDGKTYDLYFSLTRTDVRSLAVGAEVNVVAVFETTQYTARQITVTKAAGAATK